MSGTGLTLGRLETNPAQINQSINSGNIKNYAIKLSNTGGQTLNYVSHFEYSSTLPLGSWLSLPSSDGFLAPASTPRFSVALTLMEDNTGT